MGHRPFGEAKGQAAVERSSIEPAVDELVAFLDGEVDESAAEQIEHRMLLNARTRKSADELKRTWELLDFLDNPAVTEDFSRRTAEFVTSPNAQVGWGVRVRDWAEDHQRSLFRLGAVVVLILSFTVGWVAGQTWSPDSDGALLDHLAVIRARGDLLMLGTPEQFEAVAATETFADPAVPARLAKGASAR